MKSPVLQKPLVKSLVFTMHLVCTLLKFSSEIEDFERDFLFLKSRALAEVLARVLAEKVMLPEVLARCSSIFLPEISDVTRF